MSVNRLLSSWRAAPEVADNAVAWQTIPARRPSFRPLPADLPAALGQALAGRGIAALYSHQAAAWEAARQGKNVVVVTGTASGKTLCYNLPVLAALLADPQARGLYLFPTKALAQDQAAGLKELAAAADEKQGGAPLSVAVYDGDTPAGSRPAIRKSARIVITNPDMLHTGILPHHTAWAEFFRGLRFVVIDEMHTYRGVFGSHVANVVRRLRRVARFYGAFPQFILTSATIANPLDLAGRLVEAEFCLVDQDGSARGPKHFVIYNPPVVDRSLGLRRSAMQEAVRLAEDLLAYHVQTVIFARTRRGVELILAYLRQRPSAALPASDFSSRPGEGRGPFSRLGGPDDAQTAIRGYRSGYLPHQRREIEAGLRSGRVRAVVATSALELGIDIGGLGAALLVGYPGTIAATWQQAGRSGRGEEASLSVLIATADPLDQFLATHPDYLFDRTPEAALINPDNLLILLAHLRCAAFELPFTAGEGFGNLPPEALEELLGVLVAQGILHLSGRRYFWMAAAYPSQEISLRSASADSVALQVTLPGSADEAAGADGEAEGPVRVIGNVDMESAAWMVHPNAIYLHESQIYLVTGLDLEEKVAHLRPAAADYYTEPRRETTVELIETAAEATVSGGLKSHGDVRVTSKLIGFRRVKWYTHEVLSLEDLVMPPAELVTTGYWLALSEATVERLRQDGLWSNDPNRYGPNWPAQRERARQRDGYRCQVCGAAESGRSHEVHHKTPFRRFESWQQANQLDNLVTVCPSCHRKVEAAVRVRSGLAGLSFVLGHLAPLFLMCDPGDLGVHADPQSPLAGGQPAVVIYDLAPGGIGFSQRLYEIHAELIERAGELVAACACQDGCPSCVGPGGENGMGGKRETQAILRELGRR